MDKFIHLPKEEQNIVFQEAANRRGVLPIIIEKDFWVCWVLKHLFENPKLSTKLTFKGGTSLSKVYDLIERFSEDIDLTISRDVPYLLDVKDPMEIGISSKERKRRIDKIQKSAREFIASFILPELQHSFSAALKSNNWSLTLDPDDREQQTILFFYPSITTHTAGYIEPKIRLEFGARGGIEPIEHREIASYIAETFPDLFDKPKCPVHTLAAQRTFWEKATILHALHHGAKMNDRMSRHYYDMFMMATKGVADKALQDKDLLSKVVENKKVMFHDNKASYETAVIGSLRLIPDEHKKAILKKDYISMNEMFFGNPPDFEIMMSELSRLEQHINGSQDDAYLAKLVAERQNEESFEVDINEL